MTTCNFVWAIFYFTTKTITAINPICMLQNEIPKTVGEPLYMGDDSNGPYQFYIFDSNNRSVKYFDDQIYKIRLNGTKFFRRFLIQSRVATENGQILDGRAGEFLPERHWKQQGIKILDCPSVSNDAITQETDQKKYTIEAKWIAKRNDTPIQIFVYVQQEPRFQWIHLTPKSGFLFPYTNENNEVNSQGDMCNDGKCVETNTKEQRSEKLRQPTPPSEFLDKKSAMHQNRSKIVEGKTVNYCASKPCSDAGLCVNLPEEYSFECYCNDAWIGDSCSTPNYCSSHPCRNWGTCVNKEFGFACECQPGFGGQFCEAFCSTSFCKNGGTCTINGELQYSCSCPPEYFGEFCQNEVNFCTSNPCLNGGTCYDNPDGFECECRKGFMGERCHRPCQDVLQGCDYYDEKDLCDSPNENITKFYQTNCAATCGKCSTETKNVKTISPIPPLLEPLQGLVGIWRKEIDNNVNRFPQTFTETGTAYTAKLEIFRPFVSLDDNPALSFRMIGYSRGDLNGISLNNGFIYLKSLKDVKLLAVTTVGNDGLLTVEEGKMLNEGKFDLSSRYFYVHPSMLGKIPTKLKRRFSWTNRRLQINVEKLLFNGQLENVTLVFVKEETTVY